MKDAFTPLTSGDDRPVSLHNNPLVSTWIHINPEGPEHIEVYSGKVELGQGILTAIAQIAAEELRLPIAKVRMVGATTGRSPDESITSNSLSIQHSGMSVRIVCRQVRQLYIDAISASQRLDKKTMVVQNGSFYAGAVRYGSYWESRHLVDLDVLAASTQEAVTHAGQGLIGKSQVSLATAELVTGRHEFIHDMPVKGGLHGRMLRPPSINARLQALDMSLVDMAGVHKIVREGSLVGVLAEQEYIAERALVQLAAIATWDEHPCMPPEAELGPWMRTQECDTRIQTKVPERKKAAVGASKTYTADYFKPFIKHASIGPSCAYALFSGPKQLEVWSHTQGIYNLRADLAIIFGMAVEDVVVRHVPGSGCYGHNGADDVAFDAAWLARLAPGQVEACSGREQTNCAGPRRAPPHRSVLKRTSMPKGASSIGGNPRGALAIACGPGVLPRLRCLGPGIWNAATRSSRRPMHLRLPAAAQSGISCPFMILIAAPWQATVLSTCRSGPRPCGAWVRSATSSRSNR